MERRRGANGDGPSGAMSAPAGNRGPCQSRCKGTLSLGAVFLISLSNRSFFMYMSYLIAMTKTSNNMLNKSGTKGILVLFLILEEMFSAFHH